MQKTVAVLFIIFGSSLAWSQDGGWVDQLRSQVGNVCCFNYDGIRLDERDWNFSEKGFKVKNQDDGLWYEVPDQSLVKMQNKDGIARVWWSKATGDNGQSTFSVRCFLAPPLS